MTVLSSRPVKPVEPGLLSRALEVAGRLANDATDVITATAGRGARPDQKDSPFDWVTDTDRILERHTRRVLTAEFPGMPVVGEEFGADVGAAEAEYRWVVDPVDGTANYVAGVPWCAYSLALVDAAGPVVGVVADPYRGQIYAAARGRGARANGQRITLTDTATTAGAIVCTELSRKGPWPGMGDFIERAAASHAGVRVLGSAALAIAQVALGHAVAAVLHSYHEWDVAGSVALAIEAGALVLDKHGEGALLPVDGLLVAAPGTADEVLDWWQRSRAGIAATQTL
ncbi:myo-inositol-1(or 4)-monophosphatase [Herbihabitans rhizosphaerae]|uniref:inositol-phosphate phosphatase n=1 Tax=Herbihabitans rhizosphaerae TaxID=1872711 RepID=A0A4Q7L5I6_9PSEU|nr:inositol monophosphatase [Herbihabitans rhizosphaerae]RZS44506.1 myo-inositol-1(or 4)-monophosphatase [Herbihabitans rhizosphaerae]